MIYNFRTATYARNVYLYGTVTLSTIVAQEYVEPVKLYAATGTVNGESYPAGFTGFTQAQIDNALAQGWITQQEYDDTMAYRTA